MFSSVKYGWDIDSSTGCHNRDRETPLTLYIGLKIHAVAQKRTLDALFDLGMCVSCSHLLQWTSDLGNGVCDQFAVDDVVCPLKICSRLFTVVAPNNIDYNQTSAAAKDSYRNFFHAAFFSWIWR